jgi:hypothetical protein
MWIPIFSAVEWQKLSSEERNKVTKANKKEKEWHSHKEAGLSHVQSQVMSLIN